MSSQFWIILVPIPIPVPIAMLRGLSPRTLHLDPINPLSAGSASAILLYHLWFPTTFHFLSPPDFKKQVIGSSRTLLHLNFANIGYNSDDSQSTYTKYHNMIFVTPLVKNSDDRTKH